MHTEKHPRKRDEGNPKGSHDVQYPSGALPDNVVLQAEIYDVVI